MSDNHKHHDVLIALAKNKDLKIEGKMGTIWEPVPHHQATNMYLEVRVAPEQSTKG